MAVKIGHSSQDENKRSSGGLAGDQTKKEVCTRNWYEHKHGWDCVLRPKSTEQAEKSAVFVEQICGNDNVGYDQHQRNTLYKQAKALNFDGSKITTKCECDCSSLQHTAAIAGGCTSLAYGTNAYTTRTMRKAFAASGDYEVLTDKKYLTSDKYLKRGDVLLAEGYHTIMVLNDGPGVEDDGKLKDDGEWGKLTTRATQKVFGTVIDGIVSNQPMTCKKYVPNAMLSSWEFEKSKSDYKNGSSVIKAIQTFLKDLGYYTGAIDGWCGKNTVKAIQKFLKAEGYYTGLTNGGMGKKTVTAWQNYINTRL
jgi:hypothetical protein